MNAWHFLAGVTLGAFVVMGSYLSVTVISRKNLRRKDAAVIRSFEAVVAATDPHLCRIMPTGTLVQSWCCLTHFQKWVGEGGCPGHCPWTPPDPTRDRVRP